MTAAQRRPSTSGFSSEGGRPACAPHPSAAISFGFEGFEVRTARGETFIGMVASETAAELALRVPGGVIQKIAKSDVTSKTPLGVSLMTPGLETVMEEDQLVDLVEYLAGLKKPD